MSYPWFSLDGDMNMCYFYMQEVKQCHENKIYPQTNCKDEREDFLECHTRQKHVNYNINQRNAFAKFQKALNNSYNINVPNYDAATDSFVYNDGKVIANNDDVFKQYKWF